MGGFLSRGGGPKSSKSLNHFHSETKGDLGIPHFQETPKVKEFESRKQGGDMLEQNATKMYV